MFRWKTIITNAAMVVGQPPCEKNSTNGTSPSIAGGEVGDETRQCAGPQVVRVVLEHRPLERSRRDERVVRQHRGDHEREVAVELRRRRAQPDHHEDHFGPDDDVCPGEQEHQRQRRVHLAAGGQENDLVAQADDSEHREDRDGLPPRQHANCRCPARELARCRRTPAPSPATPAGRRRAARRMEFGCCPWSMAPGRAREASRMVPGRSQYRIDPIGGK